MSIQGNLIQFRFEAKPEKPAGVGGRNPNIDVLIASDDRELTAIECKFTEPCQFLSSRVQASMSLAASYFGDGISVWQTMPRCCDLAKRLPHIAEGDVPLHCLAADQLIKHAIGLLNTYPWKNWLLQGILVCGHCGHKFLCTQKKKKQARKYSCYGRTKMAHLDDSSRCDCPSYDGDWLESTAWNAFLKTVNDQELLKESVGAAIAVYKGQKKAMAASESLEGQLRKIKEKKERLGLTYSDGCIEKERYEQELNNLRKQESGIQKQLNNLDPEIRMKAQNLERLIREAQRLLGTGKIHISSFGIYGLPSDSNTVIGFGYNSPWQNNSPLQIQDAFRAIVPPADFWQRKDAFQLIKRNQRAILQDFGVKVYCFKDRLEIRGFIPPTIVQIPEDKFCVSAQDIKSGCRFA